MQEGKENAKQNGGFERKPNFDMQVGLSKDGKYWIVKRVETWILPRRYLDVIAENHAIENPAAKAQADGGKGKKQRTRNDNSNGKGDRGSEGASTSGGSVQGG